MIVDILGWIAVADAVAAVVFSTVIYAIGRRRTNPVPLGKAVGLAILLSLPAVALYVAALLLSRLM